MKILIVSDTHGHEENLERVVEKVGKIDCLLHLGDVEGQEDYIEALVSCPVHIVAGTDRTLRKEDSGDTWTLLWCLCRNQYAKRGSTCQRMQCGIIWSYSQTGLGNRVGDYSFKSGKFILPKTAWKKTELCNYGN